MSVAVQSVPNDQLLASVISSAKKTLSLSSPFVTAEGMRAVLRSGATVRLITKATAANLASRALDLHALLALIEIGGEIRSIANLHAKIYLIDGREGIVTSSNLTGPGLYQNVEMGLHFVGEPEIFKRVETVFETLWMKAIPVTATGLERLTSAVRSTAFSGGVWAKGAPSVVQDETLEPAPAIGFIEGPAPYTKPTYQVDSPGVEHGPQPSLLPPLPDECGDLLGPLPSSTEELVFRLRSTDSAIVQGALNAFTLASPDGFRGWLSSLPEDDLSALSSPNVQFPYKTRFVSRLIAEAELDLLPTIIRALSNDPSNEAQLEKYLPEFNARRSSNPKQWQELVGPSIVDICRALLDRSKEVRSSGKDFTRPNVDRLLTLVDDSDPDDILAVPIASLRERMRPGEIVMHSSVPGYQLIKRKREELGNSFRDWAFAHVPLIRDGSWDSHLPSLMAFFKELSRIELSHSDRQALRDTVALVCCRLDQEAVERRTKFRELASIWERELDTAWRKHNRDLFLKANADLAPDGEQAVRATGRWVSLYGQCIKAQKASANKDLKDHLDWLTTYLSVRKMLQGWSG